MDVKLKEAESKEECQNNKMNESIERLNTNVEKLSNILIMLTKIVDSSGFNSSKRD